MIRKARTKILFVVDLEVVLWANMSYRGTIYALWLQKLSSFCCPIFPWEQTISRSLGRTRKKTMLTVFDAICHSKTGKIGKSKTGEYFEGGIWGGSGGGGVSTEGDTHSASHPWPKKSSRGLAPSIMKWGQSNLSLLKRLFASRKSISYGRLMTMLRKMSQCTVFWHNFNKVFE